MSLSEREIRILTLMYTKICQVERTEEDIGDFIDKLFSIRNTRVKWTTKYGPTVMPKRQIHFFSDKQLRDELFEFNPEELGNFLTKVRVFFEKCKEDKDYRLSKEDLIKKLNEDNPPTNTLTKKSTEALDEFNNINFYKIAPPSETVVCKDEPFHSGSFSIPKPLIRGDDDFYFGGGITETRKPKLLKAGSLLIEFVYGGKGTFEAYVQMINKKDKTLVPLMKLSSNGNASSFDLSDILPISLQSIYTTMIGVSQPTLLDWMSVVMAERVKPFMLDLVHGKTVDENRLNAAISDCLDGEKLDQIKDNPFHISLEEKSAHMRLWQAMENLVKDYERLFTEQECLSGPEKKSTTLVWNLFTKAKTMLRERGTPSEAASIKALFDGIQKAQIGGELAKEELDEIVQSAEALRELLLRRPIPSEAALPEHQDELDLGLRP